MKKAIALLLAVCSMAVMATTALATPVYHGATDSPIGIGNVPATPTPSGYYVWSNDPLRKSWSIRWTGNNNGNSQDINWFGSIEIGGLTLTNTQAVKFEAANDSLSVSNIPFFGEAISYQAVSGPGWDGIDFTVDGEAVNVIGFNLGSSLLTGKTLAESVLATDIFIGSERKNPYVTVASVPGPGLRRTENFEIPAPVPEPGTMMLLGAGFLGLAIYGKRRRNA